MNRQTASDIARQELAKHGLSEWHVRLTTEADKPFLGLCMYNDKCIVLNAHHIDIHPDADIINTIRHEVAHAIVGPSHGHDETWQTKAIECGCDNTLPCSTLNLPLAIIDAIRSGANVEVTVEEKKIEQIIRTPKYTVTRLQEKCPHCNKPAIERFHTDAIDKNGDTVRLITLDCFHIIKKVMPKATPYESFVSNGWDKRVIDCNHEWNKHQCMKCGEFRLLPFQVIGAKFIENGLALQKGVGLFDDMGLGKTVQGLAVVKYHPEYSPTLYIVKSALTFQFFKEIIRWLGPNYLGQIIKTGKDTILPGLKSYIISYDLLRRIDRAKIEKLGIKLVIIDECQQIKNPDSTRTQEVRKLVGNPTIKVLPLSGTPWKNRGDELFPVMNILSPMKFHSHQAFLDRWVDYFYEGNRRRMGGIRNVKAFKDYTSEITIRREYNEVMDEYPDVNRMKLNFKLDELNQNTYDNATSEFVAWYNDAVIGGVEEKLSGIELLGKMAKMRHLSGLVKIPATVGFVEEFIDETDRKLVIFVHHQDVGKILYDEVKKLCVDKPEIFVASYHSSLDDEQRYEMQTKFNESKRAIMIASTLACGEGVNLQSCADAIMHERQWNPQNEEQASPGRFRRIGQKSKVINTTYVQGEGTIDEDIEQLIEEKRGWFHALMNKGEMPTWNESSFAHELASRIAAKHNKSHKSSQTVKQTVKQVG